MARELFIGTHGSDDPTRATFPFMLADGAIEGGHEPGIILMGDAVQLMNNTVAENIQGVGLPPLKEFLGKVIQNKVPIYV